VLRRIGRRRGLAVPAQIRTDNEERPGQLRCYPVPRCVRPRMAVQQHHRLPVAAMPYAQRHFAAPVIEQRKDAEAPQGP
jgi:hypothetical protein